MKALTLGEWLKPVLLFCTAMTVPEVVSAQSQWVGGSDNNNFSNSANWLGGVPSVTTPGLLSGIGGPLAGPNLVMDVSIGQLSLTGGNVSGGNLLNLQNHILTARSIDLSAGTITNGTLTVGSLNMTEGGNTTGGTIGTDVQVFTVGNSTVSGGTILGTVHNSGSFTVNGNLSGSNDGPATSAYINSGTFTVTASGTLEAASFTNAFGGTLNNAGTIFDDLTNAGTVTNNGTFNANVASNSGTINNNAGATWNGAILSNTGTINTTGTWNANGVINNAGTFNYLGGTVAGATTFTNSPSGIFNFSGTRAITTTFVNNGTISALAPSDRLTINGSLSGTGTINVAATNGNVSVVTIQGAASGSQNITVNNSGSATPVFSSPQTVLVLNGEGSSLAVGNKGLVPQISNGLVNNFLMQNGSGSNAYLQTSFNDGPVSGVASGLLSTIDALATGFFLNASAIVSRPDNPDPNQIGGGPFARVSFGGATTKLGSNAVGFGQSTSSFTNGSTSYSGLQAGFDVGVYNINGSGWNANFGIFGGVANAGTYSTTNSPIPTGGSLTNTTQLSLSVPFAALYTFISKGSFSAEVNVRKDYYSGSILSSNNATNGFVIAPNTQLTGSGWSVNSNISNRFDLKDWLYVEPMVSLNWGNYTFGNVNLNPALGLASSSISLGTIEILLGRVGANVGATFLATDNIALAPFIHGSVWHDFASPYSASAQTNGGGFDITADRVGTFGQVGTGVQFKVLDINLLGFVRGDLIFGDNITGASFNIGVRKQF